MGGGLARRLEEHPAKAVLRGTAPAVKEKLGGVHEATG